MLGALLAGIVSGGVYGRANGRADQARDDERAVADANEHAANAQAELRRVKADCARETTVTLDHEPTALWRAMREAAGGDAGSLIDDPLKGRERFKGPEDLA
jgi:hypothetical protein